MAIGDSLGPLQAMLILPNSPEGFNAYREMPAGGRLRSSRVAILVVLLVPVGPLCCLLGYLFLFDQPAVIGAVMLFAAGGILISFSSTSRRKRC
ncbi:MAG: hypothetical protein ACOCWR_10495 [Oceanidesulfovibrio sp.]